MNNAQTRSRDPVRPDDADVGRHTTDHLGYDGSGRMIGKRFLPSGSTTASSASPRLMTLRATSSSSGRCTPRAAAACTRDMIRWTACCSTSEAPSPPAAASITTPITLPGTDNQQDLQPRRPGQLEAIPSITPKVVAAVTQNRTHNKLNEITQLRRTTPVLYDHGNNAGNANPLIAKRGNGNITNDGTRIYAFDALNRLTIASRTSDGLQIAAYVYDALGRRILKVATNGGVTGPSNPVANATYRYIQDGNQIVEELAGANSATSPVCLGNLH